MSFMFIYQIGYNEQNKCLYHTPNSVSVKNVFQHLGVQVRTPI